MVGDRDARNPGVARGEVGNRGRFQRHDVKLVRQRAVGRHHVRRSLVVAVDLIFDHQIIRVVEIPVAGVPVYLNKLIDRAAGRRVGRRRALDLLIFRRQTRRLADGQNRRPARRIHAAIGVAQPVAGEIR